VVAPFVATGTVPDLFQATVIYTIEYVAAVPVAEKGAMLADQPRNLVFIFGPLVLLAALGAWHAMRSGVAGTHAPLIIGWLVANWLGIVAAGRFYDHYYVTLVAPLALLAPLGLLFLRERARVRHFRYALVAVVVALLVVPVVENAGIYLRLDPESRHAAKYSDDDRAAWENQGPEFGRWLKSRTRPGDGVYNFGFQSELYFYSDRQSPTRFIMDRPFWTKQSYIDEALEELRRDPPVYVIDSAIYEGWSQYEYYTREIKAWIFANYEYVGKQFYADVYVLKGRG
jgi:hypothetical protein